MDVADSPPFPFRSVVSLKPLIDAWRAAAEAGGDGGAQAAFHATVAARLDAAPELEALAPSPDVLEAHRDLVDLLMSAVFPRARETSVSAAAFAPYQTDRPLYATPAFLRLIGDIEADFARGPFAGQKVVDEEAYRAGRALHAYHGILSAFYGVETDFTASLTIRRPDAETGLPRYYRLAFEADYTRFDADGRPPELAPEDVRRLLAEPLNLALWRALLPPEHFTVYGFFILTATDVTDQHVLSLLKDDLLESDALATAGDVADLQGRLRTLLRLSDLELGLICLERDDVGAVAGAEPYGRSLLLSDGAMPPCPDRARSTYAQMFESGRPVVEADLGACPSCTAFERRLLEQGLRSVLLAPLHAGGRFVGLMELASPRANVLSALSALKLTDVYPLFATALQRSLREREDHIQALIKRHYTAIHPVVEWRFREAARDYLEREAEGAAAEPPPIEPIVFEEVYGLYGLTDIRHSSLQRAAALRADLTEQLALAQAVVEAAAEARPQPALDELAYRIRRYRRELEPAVTLEHESGVLEVLRYDVEALFPQLAAFGPDVQAAIAAYRTALDAELRFVYRQRKAFEESVTLINDAIAAHLSARQAEAQAILPHYFELYKTDGVDYNLYVGDALLERGAFDDLHLRSLRLWQLMATCEVAWELDKLQPALPLPLEAAHLVLVQSTPFSIRFRQEEKQFDVDGAYNVRYEVVKKRIDKAVVAGTGERLTQPGRIAVVYSSAREAEEYRRYLDYLRATGHLQAGVEAVELEDMPGAYGLKALRVAIAPRPPEAPLTSVPEPAFSGGDGEATSEAWR